MTDQAIIKFAYTFLVNHRDFWVTFLSKNSDPI